MLPFNELIKADEPVLVDFTAEWCGPCKMLAPILKEISSQVKTKIIKIDIDKNRAVAEKYQVQSVPTLILFQKGEIKWRQSGLMPKDQLLKVLNGYS